MCHDRDVPTPLLVLFYLWLAVSVAILGYRVVARRRTRAPAPVKAVDLAPGIPRSTPEAPSPPMAPAAPTSTLTPSAPSPAPSRAAPDPPSASGDGPSASLMEALAGITLPCDLVPMTTVEGRTLGPRELLLVTSGHTGAEVARALGAAIAELGYSITPLGASRALAARDADQITLIVHDRPDTVLAGKRQAFPAAGAGSVVVELRL